MNKELEHCVYAYISPPERGGTTRKIYAVTSDSPSRKSKRRKMTIIYSPDGAVTHSRKGRSQEGDLVLFLKYMKKERRVVLFIHLSLTGVIGAASVPKDENKTKADFIPKTSHCFVFLRLYTFLIESFYRESKRRSRKVKTIQFPVGPLSLSIVFLSVNVRLSSVLFPLLTRDVINTTYREEGDAGLLCRPLCKINGSFSGHSRRCPTITICKGINKGLTGS